MTEGKKAVFLSYASQDAEAARRICELLRAAGIEVWFDQSELRGGDVWDQKIRRQVRDCALFIPIISSTTQTRGEGYFRLEWDIADQRSHMIARDRAFIVPVCIDLTSEAGTDVPESFSRVQWTRTQGGEISAAFVHRISLLLSPGQPDLKPHATTASTAGQAPPAGDVLTFWKASFVPLLVVAVAALGIGYLALEGSGLSKRVARPAPAERAQVVAPVQSAIPEKSIAVIPFVDMSEKHDQEYFSDGLSEELIDMLTRIPDLRVPARTSSSYFKGKSEKISIIARDLGVAHVLEGSVRRAGNRLRVTAQLINAGTGYHLWSATYDRELKDVFKIQDEIASAVVAELKVKLAPQQSPSSRTSNTESYNQYLIGRQFLNLSSQLGFERAAVAFRKAISIDPEFAPPYGGLSRVETWLAVADNDQVGLRRAQVHAERAIALAPDSVDGYVARGYLRSSALLDLAGARQDIDKALSIDPNDPPVLRRHAELLEHYGRLPEAVAVLRRAVELDPLSGFNWGYLAWALVLNGQYIEARQAYAREVEINPDTVFLGNELGQLDLLDGHPTEALAEFRALPEGADRQCDIAIAEYSSHHLAAAQTALDDLIGKYGTEHPYLVAEVFAWRGENDAAFHWLDLAYSNRNHDLIQIKEDPLLRPLHSDSRYEGFLRHMLE